MKKSTHCLSSIQEYNQFKTRIFDAVDDWLTGEYADPEMGIAIDPKTLNVTLSLREIAPRDWFPLESLAPNGQASADAVLDLADLFCFVR